MNENDVRAAMRTVTSQPAPVSSRIDIEQAMRRGRHRRTRHRLLTAAGAVAAVTLAVGGVSLLRDGRPATSHPAAVPAADEGFDPLATYADFGWLPTTMTERSMHTATDSAQVSAGQPRGSGKEFWAPQVLMTFFPPGQPITYWPSVHTHGIDVGCPHGDQIVPAPSIRGRRAEWVIAKDVPGTRCRPTAEGLRWQYAANAWAIVLLDDLSQLGNHKTALRHIATTARFEAHGTVRMPFQLTWLPAGLHVTEAIGEKSAPRTGKWRVSLTLSSTASALPRSFSIEIVPTTFRDQRPYQPPNTAIGGRPARLETSGTHVSVRTNGAPGGMEINMQADGLSKSEVLRILHGVHLGDIDPSKWTAPAIR
jgi:hypothetical protein